MNDKEQQMEWIKQALIQDGFEELNFPAMTYKKEIKKETYVMINLKEKLEPFFMVVGNRIDEDDEAGTLAAVATLIVNAMDGQMPTQKNADEVIGDVPPVEIPDEPEVQAMPETTREHMPAVHKPPIKMTQFTPTGTMIKGIVPQLKEIGKLKIGKKGMVKNPVPSLSAFLGSESKTKTAIKKGVKKATTRRTIKKKRH